MQDANGKDQARAANGNPAVVALLLSGGGGTRLWPVSTGTRPKQFLKLFGERSLFQRTVGRLRAAAVEDLMVVTNVDHEQQVREQTTEMSGREPTLVLEPMRRDSAPAIAAGVAALLRSHPPDTVAVVLPCDHLIPDEAHFARALHEGVRLAALGHLVTFGIRPTFASTEFGYIQRGGAIAAHDNAFVVAKFHEKPKSALAEQYLAQGGFDWNSGIFAFGIGTFAAEAERHMPAVWSAAQGAAGGGESTGRRLLLDAAAFAQAPKISIDYALFERSDRVGVVPVDFEWSDVGNWGAVHTALERDAEGNASVGAVTLQDCRGNLVIGEGADVMVLGVSDLVVVASPHGTFVAPRARAAEVKAMLERKEHAQQAAAAAQPKDPAR